MSEEALVGRLESFLSEAGTSIAAVLAEVDDALGTPALVVASGSVLMGFGNKESDVDLYVIVPQTSVTDFPILSFSERARVDTVFLCDAEIDGTATELRRRPWPPQSMPYATWTKRRRALAITTRLALGLVLAGTDERRQWQRELTEGWLWDRSVEWWYVESLRLRTVARWLLGEKPILAAKVYCDAVIAALQGYATAEGERYFTVKWVPAKLRRLSDHDKLEVIRAALRAPSKAGEVEDYAAFCERHLSSIFPSEVGDESIIELFPAAGVTAWPVNGGTLVSRWRMRGLEFRDPVPSLGATDAAIWSGRSDDERGVALDQLFQEDMLWLGIRRNTTAP